MAAPFHFSIQNIRIHTNFKGVFWKLRQGVFFNGFAFPVRNNFFKKKAFLFRINIIGIARSCLDGVQLFGKPLPGNFRDQGTHSARRAVGSHDQLIVKYIEGYGFTCQPKGFGQTHRRSLTFGFLVRSGKRQGSFHAYRRL